ncbi:MAG: hypothetical protein P1U58_08820, partial [Verrucomicrobiales bacterium]|nr:hypothetical protein [Verrucomicrobiales bacterium]
MPANSETEKTADAVEVDPVATDSATGDTTPEAAAPIIQDTQTAAPADDAVEAATEGAEATTDALGTAIETVTEAAA